MNDSHAFHYRVSKTVFVASALITGLIIGGTIWFFGSGRSETEPNLLIHIVFLLGSVMVTPLFVLTILARLSPLKTVEIDATQVRIPIFWKRQYRVCLFSNIEAVLFTYRNGIGRPVYGKITLTNGKKVSLYLDNFKSDEDIINFFGMIHERLGGSREEIEAAVKN